jgi:hypothetical protein
MRPLLIPALALSLAVMACSESTPETDVNTAPAPADTLPDATTAPGPASGTTTPDSTQDTFDTSPDAGATPPGSSGGPQ